MAQNGNRRFIAQASMPTTTVAGTVTIHIPGSKVGCARASLRIIAATKCSGLADAQCSSQCSQAAAPIPPINVNAYRPTALHLTQPESVEAVGQRESSVLSFGGVRAIPEMTIFDAHLAKQ